MIFSKVSEELTLNWDYITDDEVQANQAAYDDLYSYL